MHLAAHHWMRPEPLELTLARLQRFGYDSIGIVGEPDRYPVEETKRLLQKYGIKCYGTGTLMFGDRDLISPDEDQRKHTVEYSKNVVQMAADLGASMCLVVPAPVGKTVPTSTPENEWRWAIEGLKNICSFAAERGIRIALEPQNRFSTYFLNRVDQTLLLAKEVGFNCGIAYDAFHASIEEKDMYAALRSCGPYLADFHVAENNRLAPGDGMFDWQRIVSILEEIGYDGGLAMECLPKVDRVPPPSFQKQQATQDNLTVVKPGLLPPMEEQVSNLVSEEYFSSLLEKTATVIGPLLRKQ